MTTVTTTRALLIMNHRSGSAEPERVRELLRTCGAELRELDVTELDAFDPTNSPAVDRVIVAGGDGSVAPAAQFAGGLGCPLGVLATGTANDFARVRGLPTELKAACELAVNGNELRWVDLGFHGDRPFLNVASTGLSVTAARRAAPLKRRLGALAYAAGAIRAGVGGRPLRARVRVDEIEVFAGWAWQIIVSNTGAFGGGAEVPADEHDALLDVTVIPRGPRLDLIRRAWGMRLGDLAGQGGVDQHSGHRIEVETRGARLYVADGEACPEPYETAVFTVQPAAFQLIAGF